MRGGGRRGRVRVTAAWCDVREGHLTSRDTHTHTHVYINSIPLMLLKFQYIKCFWAGTCRSWNRVRLDVRVGALLILDERLSVSPRPKWDKEFLQGVFLVY